MLAIETKGLGKTWRSWRGSHEALRGIDLAIERGKAFGLIGLNGAGKTTCIKILLGVVRPTRGSVRVLGGDPEDREVRRRIGYLPERLYIPAHLDARGFLASVARLKGLRDPERQIARQLGRVGLAADATRRIGGFSKGMRQRLMLSAALLGEPDLLILDEPTDGIDPLGRAEVRRILAEERARGATLFLNSHLLSETERICDRIGILSEGRLVLQGSLEELCGTGNRYRARFAGANPAALARFGFEPAEEPNTFRCVADRPEDLDRALQGARAAGALLLELRQEMRDLEQVLQEAVGRVA